MIEDTNGLDTPIGLELQIETATGLTNIDEIANASDRAETLIFGPADMSASLGLPTVTAGLPMPGYPGDHWHYVLSRILIAARDAGLQAIDGPYLVIKDLDGFREMAMRARALGYDGKWALHPGQIDVLNEVFTPTQDEFDKAEAMLEAYAHATDVQLTGAVMFGTEMIDEASRKMAEQLAMRGRAAGMSKSKGPLTISSSRPPDPPDPAGTQRAVPGSAMEPPADPVVPTPFTCATRLPGRDRGRSGPERPSLRAGTPPLDLVERTVPRRRPNIAYRSSNGFRAREPWPVRSRCLEVPRANHRIPVLPERCRVPSAQAGSVAGLRLRRQTNAP